MTVRVGLFKIASALMGSDHGPLMVYLVADTEAELVATLDAVLEPGNLGYAIDTGSLWSFDGAAWELLATAGGGGGAADPSLAFRRHFLLMGA